MLDADNLPPSYNPGELTGNDIRRLMAREAGWAILEPKIRVLDDAFTPLTLPLPNNPNDPTDCQGYATVTSVEMNTARDVHRQCALIIRRIPGVDFNPLRQYIRVSLCFYDATRKLLLEMPRGTFGFQLPDTYLSSAQTIWQITGYDTTWDIRDAGFRNFYTPPAGIPYTTVVQAALLADSTPASEGGRQPISNPYVYPDANNPGLTPGGCDHSGLNWPLSRLTIPPSPEVLPSAIPFDWKTNQLTAWNSLLDGIQYWGLWADEVAGIATAQQPYFTDSIPQAQREYSTKGTQWGPSTMKNVVLKVDSTTIANVVMVVSENNSTTPIIAFAENHASDSLVSIENRGGKRVQKTIQNDKIANQSTADFAAGVALQWAAAGAETVSFDTAIDPLSQVHDPLLLNVWNRDNTIQEIDSSVIPFIETYWKEDYHKKLTSRIAGKSVRL